MKTITKFLLFLSKSDKDIISICSNSTRSTKAALGLFVLVTAILAFISGTYALSTIFYQINENTGELYLPLGKLLISIFIGIIYALLIANIDREIVSSSNRYAVLVRLPLAVILGIVLAYPLELKLMESRITKHLITMSDRENETSIVRMQDKITKLSNRESILLNSKQNEKKEIAKWSGLMHAETGGLEISGSSGRAGQGKIFNEAERNMELHKSNLKSIESELIILRDGNKNKLEIINNEYKKNYRAQSFDFLSRMEALSNLKEESQTVNLTAWGILLVLIILELTPALLKLISTYERKTEYDILMEARLGINNTSISSFANNAINEIEQDVNNANNDYVLDMKQLVRI